MKDFFPEFFVIPSPPPILSHPIRTLVRMNLTAADKIMGDLRRMDFHAADKPTILGALTGVQRLRGILDAIEINAAARLNDLTHSAPAELAAATQRSRTSADRVYERAATLASVPSFAALLEAGRLQGAHVDTVAKVRRTVEAKHASAFAAALPEIVASAAWSNATPDDLARALNRTARALENDNGMTRSTEQRRDTALHTWTDKRTGMFRLSGRFDPLSGVMLHGHLQAMLAALFAERVPSTCPTDPGSKQDHLRALALLALIRQQQPVGLTVVPDNATSSSDSSDSSFGEGEDNGANDANRSDVGTDDEFDEWASFFRAGPSRLGRPEIVVVVDARQTTLDANSKTPVIDWGLPVELPPRVLEDLFARADAHPIIVHNGIVLHAPGDMNLGRSTRLASRAQRRALRALYPTCAVPGCGVAFEFTKPHHVHYWEHGGTTDLHNLIPVCGKHHHAVHDGGWRLSLQPDRTLTITYPDGGVQTTGPPPRIRAA